MDIRKTLQTQLTKAGDRLKHYLSERKITKDKIFLLVIVVFMAHPRNIIYFFLGFILFISGFIVRIWSKSAYGSGETHFTAPSAGPYRLIRHPYRLGSIIQVAGLWAACFSFMKLGSFLLLGFVMIIYFFFIYKEDILFEEESCYNAHGTAWEEYCALTPPLIPKITDLNTITKQDFSDLKLKSFEDHREWKIFAIWIGMFMFLWFKLVYRL
ncbi:methyltransferase family protein [Elusimicrobiota bacterium]